jgi:hypothetical protein
MRSETRTRVLMPNCASRPGRPASAERQPATSTRIVRSRPCQTADRQLVAGHRIRTRGRVYDRQRRRRPSCVAEMTSPNPVLQWGQLRRCVSKGFMPCSRNRSATGKPARGTPNWTMVGRFNPFNCEQKARQIRLRYAWRSPCAFLRLSKPSAEVEGMWKVSGLLRLD